LVITDDTPEYKTRKGPEYPECTSATKQNNLAGNPDALQRHNYIAFLELQHMGSSSQSGRPLFIKCPCQTKRMTQEIRSAAAVASSFVQTERAIFDAGPELPKLKLPETKPDPGPMEKILNMDEETFRRLFNIQKVELQRSGDQEMNEVD
jgi:hypothetical protein